MNETEKKIMEQIHKKHFQMLCKIDDVCSKHNINYFLDSGTLLGALRHQDIIPWDDDVDLCFKREDYDRLMEHKEEFSPYRINVPDYSDGFFWDFTSRMFDENVVLKKDSEESDFYNKTNCHYLFTDLFVMDNYPGGLRGKLQIYELIVLYIMALSRRYKGSHDKKGSLLVDLPMFLISNIGKLFSLEWIYKRYRKVQTRYNNKPCDYYLLSNISIVFLPTAIAKKEWYKQTAKLPIRNRQFSVPWMYKEKLESDYGDYMKMPPEDMQQASHIINFDHIVFK